MLTVIVFYHILYHNNFADINIIGESTMRVIETSKIIEAVSKMCIEANYYLNSDVRGAIEKSLTQEQSPIGCQILEKLLVNADLAKNKSMAICQDTGITVVFVTIGQDVHVTGGSIDDAINEGVRQGYQKGYLRKSIVGDPLERVNTGDNTPAVIYYEIVPGDQLKIDVAPKGFGCENMGALKMLKPSDGIEGVKAFILETVDKAGPNPCPPLIIGVGIGGTMEKAALIAKKALMRPLDVRSDKEHIRLLEEEMLEKINKLGIGPSGLGGNTTALAINIDTYPTHIAGLPVAVNISCHATRHAQITL